MAGPRARARYEITADDKSARAFSSFRARARQAAGTIGRVGLAAAGAGIAGFAVMAREALVSADRVQKLSQQTGASTEFLSEMRFVASQAGTDLEGVGNSMRKLAQNLRMAGDGSKTQARAFAELGLSVSRLEAMDPERAFLAVGDALNRIQDPTRKQALAMELLGRSGQAMLSVFSQGAAGVEQLRDRAREMGTSLSREAADGAAAANDAFDRLSTSIRGMVETLTLQFAPGLADLVDSFRQNLLPFVGTVISAFSTLGRTIGGVAAGFAALARGNLGEALSIGRDVVGDLFGGGGGQDQRQVIGTLREIAANTRTQTGLQ